MLSPEEKKAVIDLFPFLRERPVVFDIGSNKGHWADVILEEYGYACELHLVEPIEKLLSYTQIKYEYHPNITYYNLVAHSKEGMTDFFYFENYNNEISSIYDGGNEWKGLPKKEKPASCVRIDELYRDYIDLIKIDCEGADMDVLVGCEKLLKENKIGIIQIEYSKHWERGGHEFHQMYDLAKKYGYKVYRFIGNNFYETNDSDDVQFDNYYLTKEEIHNHSVGGWNNEFILNTSELPKMDLVLEIGAFEGLTTKYICENLLNEGGRVVVVDPLEDHYVPGDTEHPYFKGQYPRFKRNTRGLPVELNRGLSQDELPKLNALRFDLVFIDGNHYAPHPYIDACWAFAITKPQGYILFDDYTWRPETTASIDKFLEEFNGAYDLIIKGYQVLIRKVTNRYNDITQSYYL